MMIFSVLVFFGGATFVLFYSLRQEERKMRVLKSEDALDTHSPRALRELRAWIEAHPSDPDVDAAREAYRECVEALRATDRHFYDWSDEDIEQLEAL
jgi:lipoate-protein ligase A